jgi:hypothetical protein
MMALYRLAAIEVADELGYAYPHELDQRVTAYVHTMKDVPHGAEPKG